MSPRVLYGFTELDVCALLPDIVPTAASGFQRLQEPGRVRTEERRQLVSAGLDKQAAVWAAHAAF